MLAMPEHRMAFLSLKRIDGLDNEDNLSLVCAMDIFSSDRWDAISKVAKSIGATDWQTRKWRTRRRIPGSWHLSLLAECETQGVALVPAELMTSTQREGAAA